MSESSESSSKPEEDSDLFNIEPDLPTVDEILTKLPIWEDFIIRLGKRVEEAKKRRQRTLDSENDKERWQYTSEKNVECSNEECNEKESADGWYEYTPREDELEQEDYIPVKCLCSTCFNDKDVVCQRIRMYETETVEQRIERSKNEEEWVFVKYKDDKDRTIQGDVLCMREEECNYDACPNKIHRYNGSDVLRGTNNEVALCDWCRNDVAIDDDEVGEHIRRIYG